MTYKLVNLSPHRAIGKVISESKWGMVCGTREKQKSKPLKNTVCLFRSPKTFN